MLKKDFRAFKQLVAAKGKVWVSNELGYKTTDAVSKWLLAGAVAHLREKQVEQLLERFSKLVRRK